MRNEKEQGKQGPSPKRSYRLDQGVYDYIESTGAIVKDKNHRTV